ncbi:ubiquinol-cytochrome C reductase complex core protein-like protein 2 [Patellaria atrata CBS 101060]|uniref:Cytochrome b-c1 complex subunit 2, mitochondrial n=1 Tax=Patellaria atrata CBS 101060 TaxID=1346257 RepID=A0A9P4SD47_9PEZI|nr:ubiquinol-cytochrome C reductase complex core protein-like protein 2 [Patellaria atrata CBS 101060]
MLSRSSLGRGAQRALRRQCCSQPTNRRGLAAPASGSFAYQTGDSSGIKVATRDLWGPTTTLALVAKAGTRYEPLPGLAQGLEKFAFTSTEKRSALRIVREVELLGGEVQPYHTRENLILQAKFLRDDLPYFLELLAEVTSKTRYDPWVFDEHVSTLIQFSHRKFLANTSEMALNSAHSLAFHRGLGTPLFPTSSHPFKKYLNADFIGGYSGRAFAKSNIAIVANGADHSEVTKWVSEFFTDLPSTTGLSSEQTKYYGGEERIAHDGGNSVVLAFPGSSTFTGGFYKPEIAVLAALLGGETSVKWASGYSLLAKAAANHPGATVSTKSMIYSDAGLLTVKIDGPAKAVAGTTHEVVKTIKEIAGGELSKDDLKKAIAQAKFKELEYGESIRAGLELTGTGLIQGGKPYQLDESAKAIEAVTEEQVKKVAKELLDFKASVSSVGDLYVLPFAEELGLKV